MLVVLSLLVASALAGNDGPIPPHLRRCENITIQSAGNCPRKGYECDELMPIKYNVRSNNWAEAEVQCVDKNALLAVDHQIVDKVRCRDQKWRALGSCDIPTTSVVCAKCCDADVCPSSLHRAPRKYARLNVHEANERSQCAYAKCKYGFVALHRNGTLIKELDSKTTVTCSGDGKWTISETEKYAHMMCKRRPKSCDHECNDKPWTSPLLNATSAAIRNGCSYSCPTGQVLTRSDETFARTITCATCTRRGFLIDDDQIVRRIGCSTCDVADGPIETTGGQKPAISTGCVLTCPRGYRLRYGLSSYKFAPGNILYRQIHPIENNWITAEGFVLNRAYNVNCARRN